MEPTNAMNLRLLASALGLLVASQSLTGCFFLFDHRDYPDDPPPLVPPRDESASFRFTASRGCGPFTSCAPSRPLMAGVRESLEVTMPDDYSGAAPTVTSSDPSVVSVSVIQTLSAQGGTYRGVFDVVAGEGVGSAEITVTQRSGQSSTVSVRVDQAAGMDLVEDEGTGHYDRSRDHIALRVGERVSMNGYPVNGDGVRLYGNNGVVWTVPSTGSVALSWGFMQGERVADDHVYVEGRAPGTEVVTVRAGVVERTIIVDVR
jgi:hypothetical protein